MRRLMVIIATVALLAAVPGTAMAAEGDINVAGEGPVTEPSNVTVQVQRDFLDLSALTAEDCDGQPLGIVTSADPREPICNVSLAIQRASSTGSGQVSSSSQRLDCHRNCDSNDPDPVYGPVKLDPTDAGPFKGIPEVERCNGTWTLAASIDSSASGGDANPTRNVTLSGPPTAPTDVSVQPGEESAQVSWKRAPLGDVTGHLIERNTGDGWQRAGAVGGDATSFSDSDAPSGEVQYRVATQRADGFVTKNGNKRPVAKCGEDTGRDLSSADHPDGNKRYGTGSGTVRAASTSGPGSGSGGGAGGSAGSSSLSANPGDLVQGSSDSADEPQGSDLPGYGEGMGFNRELDFGQNSSQGTPNDEVLLDESMASGSGVERYLDPERIAIPIALGLLLIVLGAHIRAWMNSALPEEAGSASSGTQRTPDSERSGPSGWWGRD